MDRAKLIEAFKSADENKQRKVLRESGDAFSVDMEIGSGGTPLGQDFTPLLGGPFNKQLYYYDYLRMHALAFQAFHHDPIARRIVNLMRDFTLGRGFAVDFEDDRAQALWNAVVEANDLHVLMDQAAIELSIYGEIMLWELPNNETKIGYQIGPGQTAPGKGIIPRFRLVDPSVIWEIVTYPEDITRVLYYQWVAPTQYQIYTSGNIPSTKFIVQQIPAEQMDHIKINCVSNEKRGRSDLFPVLGYMKRLRDSVNFQIAALQKTAAWAIDTTVRGSQADIDNYINDAANAGQAPAGSEFVHTDAIKREYLGLNAGSGTQSPSFEWSLSMICAGSGIPVSYLGTTTGNQSTRASALVATEPVAKLFEMRQSVLERVLRKIIKRTVEKVYPNVKFKVTFPEIIVQDRSQKFKDLMLAQSQGWIAKETAATIAGKELQITGFDYDLERPKIAQEMSVDQASIQAFGANFGAPLTAPAEQAPTQSTSAVTQNERKSLDQNDGF